MGDLGPELYYMRNRWYEPQSGRFLSEDPIGLAGGINQYAFAGNDPVGGRDPLGLADCDVWIWKTLDAKGNVVDWGILDVVCWEDDDDDDGPGGGPQARPQDKRRDLTCPLYAKFGIHCAPRPKPAEIKQCFAQNTAWMASDNALVAGAVGIGGSLASITGGAVASRWGHQWVYDATVEMDLFFGTRSSNARMFEGAIAAWNAGKGLIRTGGRFLRGAWFPSQSRLRLPHRISERATESVPSIRSTENERIVLAGTPPHGRRSQRGDCPSRSLCVGCVVWVGPGSHRICSAGSDLGHAHWPRVPRVAVPDLSCYQGTPAHCRTRG